MTDPILAGSKGGGAKPPRPSVEAPDSLHSTAYARILDLVSEGEIVGLKNGKRSVFLNETPLANADGSLNFSGVSLETRNGSQDQTYIPGFPAVENESQVAVELRSDQPWTRAITNLQLSAVRIRLAVSRLAQTNTSNGDTNGYTVRYVIELSTDGGAFVEVLQSAFSGKSSSKYERSHRVDLPAAKAGWTVRVRRLTANSSSGAIADTTSVESITDVIDAKLRYPGSAIIGLQFDASQFQSIPNRSFELQGRIIRVPSNYDPATRAYSGVWDGTFKSAWTDNPAWIYYDLLLHQRYGLGHLLNAGQVDKWELYRIGQYCDQPVSDGKGGTEPRFTCNLYLSVRADALKVLQDLATTFRGMAYWGAGSVMAVADMPEDPVYTYSNANVIDGKFVYGGSAKKTRYSVALVSWNDPADFYRQKVQYVDDPEGIARYGVQQTEITATGCTSQAQAQRIGKWALLTNRLETESVSFSVGLDGTLVRPGQVIRVADNDRAGRRIGGRLRSATLDALVLDADVKAYPGDTLTLIMPTGKAISRVIKSVGYPLTWDSTGITWDSGATTLDTTGFPAEVQRVVLEKKLEELPPVHSMWAIDSPTLAVQQFRVLSVAEDFSDSAIKYSISAVKHVGAKFAAIDNGARIDQPPVTVIPPSVQNPPKNVRVRNEHFVDQGSAVGVMTIDWERPDNAIAYEVHWRKNDGDWVFAGRTGGNAFEVSGIYAGRYVAKVRAINALDIGSVFATSAETVLSGKTTPPPMVASFNAESIVFGIKLKWSIPAGLSTADLQRTEIWYSPTDQVETASKLGDYAYPQADSTMQGLAAGAQFFFWARLVDRTGNVGPLYPSGTGVRGQASADANLILDYIKGKIEESSLGQHLKDEIDKISGDGPGSINERLEAIKDLIKQYTDALAWDSAKTYSKGEIVRQGQNLYQALGPVPAGTQPPNAQYWKDVGTILEEANALAGEVHNLMQQITNIDGKLTAVSEKVDGVFVQLNPKMAGDSNELVGQDTGYAGVWSVWSAVAEGDYVQAKKTETVEADLGKTNARVVDLTTAMATADSALGERITQVDAKVGQNTAAIRDETKARVDAVGAVAQRTSTVETNLNGVSLKADEGLRVAQEVNGKFSQMWSMRLQYNPGTGEYKFAGIGLSIENGPNGVVQSKFVIDADMFAIQQGGNVPFTVEGGQVFMKSAFIQNGSINMLKIGNNLTSSNYEKDVQGWAFLPDGTFQMMATAPGGNKLVINNSGIYIYYPNGVKAIDLSVDAS